MEQMSARPCFLAVSQTFMILRLFLMNMLLIKNRLNLRKLITLCSEKLNQRKYPQKLISWNSKVKINDKLRMGKAWRFFKTCINIDREKYVFLLLLDQKNITSGSLLEITKCFYGQQNETTS